MLRWTLDPWDIIHTWWIEGHSDDSANLQFVRIQSHLGDSALGVSLGNYLDCFEMGRFSLYDWCHPLVGILGCKWGKEAASLIFL